MKKYVIICLLLVLIIAAILLIAPWQKEDPNDPDTYLGSWVAVEYLRTSNVQMIDSHEHLGNHIVLTPDEYYSEYVQEYFPPSSVDSYIITEITSSDLWSGYRTRLFEIGIEEDSARALFRVDFSGEEDMIGVITSTEEMICNTGGGWYRYERNEK